MRSEKRSRSDWKKEAEAKFLAASLRDLIRFAQTAGFPVTAYLLMMAELDIGQQALLPDYLEVLKARRLVTDAPQEA